MFVDVDWLCEIFEMWDANETWLKPFYLPVRRSTRNAAEQYQRANPLSAPRIEMNVNMGSTSYMNIHKLKREVDSLKQRQQEIQSFNQVRPRLLGGPCAIDRYPNRKTPEHLAGPARSPEPTAAAATAANDGPPDRSVPVRCHWSQSTGVGRQRHQPVVEQLLDAAHAGLSVQHGRQHGLHKRYVEACKTFYDICRFRWTNCRYLINSQKAAPWTR